MSSMFIFVACLLNGVTLLRFGFVWPAFVSAFCAGCIFPFVLYGLVKERK